MPVHKVARAELRDYTPPEFVSAYYPPPEPYLWDEESIDPESPVAWDPHITDVQGALPAIPKLYPGRSYFVAKSLEAELRDLDYLYPGRATKSDGWLGDASHQARASDHNPDWAHGGIIRAGDLTTTSLSRAQQLDLINDLIATEKANPIDRIWYVIHRFPGDNHTHIWSRTHGWKANIYSHESAMPHDHHFHTSIMRTTEAATDTKPWFAKLIEAKEATGTRSVSVATVAAAFTSGVGNNPIADVQNVQWALNQNLSTTPKLAEDGYAGPATRARYKLWQEHCGYTGPDAEGIPTEASLSKLTGLVVTT